VTVTEVVRYVVEVNDASVNANGHGRAWWADFQCSTGGIQRITWVAMTPGGGLAHIRCEDREEAVFVRDYMVQSGGLHPKTVKVKKLVETRGDAEVAIPALRPTTEENQ
jgi:hypothetical protein